MYTRPKKIVKTGVPCKPHADGQQIAEVYVCISYETGLPLYYRVSIGRVSLYHLSRGLNMNLKVHNFLTFEEAMLFCDINGYWVDTRFWSDPDIGMTMFYSPSTTVQLDDGRTIEVGY